MRRIGEYIFQPFFHHDHFFRKKALKIKKKKEKTDVSEDSRDRSKVDSMHQKNISTYQIVKSKRFDYGLVFVAFVEDNTTMCSIRYFENHVSYFVHNRRK